MQIKGNGFMMRPWRRTDLDSLVRHANNRNVAANLTDKFPHPYRAKDGREWLREATKQDIKRHQFAIVINGKVVGGIGMHFHNGGERYTATFGYWLGEPYWGKGIMSEAVGKFTDYAFNSTHIQRMEARVFPWNPASGRVLEKNGFTRDGFLRKSHSKAGKLVDEYLYSRIRK